MSQKEDLIKSATALGITLSGDETVAVLRELIENHAGNVPPQPEGSTSPEPGGERMIPMSDVKKLIAEEMAKMTAQQDEQKGARKVKRVQEHHVQLHRWNSKWVIDFVNQNNDPYLKVPVHAFDVWNQEKRQNIAHIELVLLDEKTGEKTTEKVALTRYLERRINIFCPILNRIKKDASYSIGEVEIKKDKGDGMMKGTGVYRDQEVTIAQETFELKTPEGTILKVPDYAIC